MAKPNGNMSIGQGKVRLQNMKTGEIINISPYLTGVSVTNAEKPVGETPVEDGVLLGIGQRGASTATCTSVYTEGETANDEGDVYADKIYPLYDDPAQELENWVMEWQKSGWQDNGGEPFATGTKGWTTDPNFSRVVHADPPSIERTGNTGTTVQFKIATERVYPITF